MTDVVDAWQRRGEFCGRRGMGMVVSAIMLGMGMAAALHANALFSSIPAELDTSHPAPVPADGVQPAATGAAPFSPHFDTATDVYMTGPSFDASQIPLGTVTLGFMPSARQILHAYASTDGVSIRGRFAGAAGGERITGQYQGQTIEFMVQYHWNGGIYLHRIYNGMPDFNFTPASAGVGAGAARDAVMIGPWKQIISPVFFNVDFLRNDGSRDTSMPDIPVRWEPSHVLLQDDGKLVRVFESEVHRTSVDGSEDTTFNRNPGSPSRLLQLRDGRIIFVSYTEGPGFQLRFLRADGTPDPTVAPIAWDGHTNALAQQPDGKILVAGGVSGIIRLNLNGTVDSSFQLTTGHTPASIMNAYVSAILVLPDGKILAGGHFDIANGDNTRKHLVRLHPDGTTDSTFTTATDNTVTSLLRLCDGSILAAGDFRVVTGPTFYTPRRGFVRLTPEGTADLEYDPMAAFAGGTKVRAANVQWDGSILISGVLGTNSHLSTTTVALARFISGPAVSTVTVTPGGGIRWHRGGGAADLTYTTFEYRGDGETSWTTLGDGVRETGGWFRAHIAPLPATGLIRVKGRIMASNRAQGMVMESHPFGRSELTALEQWRGDRLGDPSGSGPAAMDADPDGDGIINLLEYGLRLDPIKPDATSALPVWTAVDGAHEVTITVPPGATILYGAEWSTTLRGDDWHPAQEAPATEGRRTFRVPHDAPGTPAGNLFFRLRMTE